jgi:NADP-dependent 3-hydroxy acid dehydrogenase YdfG
MKNTMSTILVLRLRARTKGTSVSAAGKVAVITGASRGIGEGLVKAYRDRDYRVVAAARSIRQTDDAQILAVPGDICR